jgi:acyl-coenzyme A synthetase/AMP-(fatty) acid ligase
LWPCARSACDRPRSSAKRPWNQPGIIPENEQAEGRRLCAELEDEVARGAPRAHGIQRGERVGLLLLMIAEATISLLAAAKIGAVTLPT